MPAAPKDDPSARAAELAAELAAVREQMRADDANKPVQLRVTPPHDSFTYGGITVGAEATPVPAHAVAILTGAAADAGVMIEEA